MVAQSALVAATVAAAVMTPAGASTSHTITIKTAQVPKVGLVLTTNAGLTLYHLTSDPTGTSTCTGACAQIWLPLLLPKGDHLRGRAV
jgi:predicted lipoprotein with Yx(FWY)xxD motif